MACIQKENCIGTSSDDGHKIVNKNDTEVASRALQDKLVQYDSSNKYGGTRIPNGTKYS
ncbi:hypothetical protein L1049_001954 [Liquidambar formosana]|uniref:Uncharacterized protein n=1 Tax=Liquidambar formosana TaxID=63359 RepID=A0AAP0NE07_LIQFO